MLAKIIKSVKIKFLLFSGAFNLTTLPVLAGEKMSKEEATKIFNLMINISLWIALFSLGLLWSYLLFKYHSKWLLSDSLAEEENNFLKLAIIWGSPMLLILIAFLLLIRFF